MESTKKDVYAIVTDRIVALLEGGTVPWRKPWSGGGPKNVVSGKAYRGVNVFVLACQGYSSPSWLTYRQATQLGGSVRRGEHGSPVIFWNWIEKTDPANATRKIRFPILKYFTVFNVEQCDGIAVPAVEKASVNPIEAAEAIVAGMPTPPSIRHLGDQAFYRPSTDSVVVPAREAFDSAPAYYATVFHEIAHSTGHYSRLDRPAVAAPSFGSHAYSKEELVAEMSAAFLCAEAGIDLQTIDNSAAYIASWLSALRNDRRLLVQAAAAAQKAADYVLGRKNHEEGTTDTAVQDRQEAA